MTFVGQTLSDKIAAVRRRSPGLCRTRKVKVEMVNYFDEKHCREYECIFYDPDVILCCKRNFKDPADGMDVPHTGDLPRGDHPSAIYDHLPDQPNVLDAQNVPHARL